jgi:hypothetical protein
MMEETKTNFTPRKRRSHPWAFPLGLVIIGLAVVGTVTLISYGVNGIKQLTDKSALKAEYEVFLKDVVRNDPKPFDDIKNADMSFLLDSAIWDFLVTAGFEEGKYEYSESEPIGYRVPADDIERHFIKLFGTEIEPVYAEVLGAGYTFAYDEATEFYTIPVTSSYPLYTAKVFNVDKKGGSIILTVGYLGFGEWEQDEKGRYIEPIPDKYMRITLRERATEIEGLPGYYVGAIQATVAEDLPDATTKAPETTTAVPETTIAVPEETEAPDETGETGATGTTGQSTTAAAD